MKKQKLVIVLLDVGAHMDSCLRGLALGLAEADQAEKLTRERAERR
jgi:hypothetical protein